jgi:photosystem II stability/assembly factor-like uncharacterized protein
MKSKMLFTLLLITVSVGLAFNWHGAAIAPDGQNCWVVAIDTNRIKHSLNFCQTWQTNLAPDERTHFDVFFINAQKGWIGSDQGFIFGTSDGGDTWRRQVAGLAKWAARIFFLDTSYGWAACGGAMVGRTTDGGAYWEQLQLPYPPFHVDSTDLYGISFVNKRKGWTCAGRFPEYIESIPGQGGDTWYTKGQGFIAISNDSGLNWSLSKKDTIYDYYDLKFVDSLTGFVVGGNDRNNLGVVLKTTNGGQTWQIISIPVQTKILRALEFVGNRHGWAVGRNGTIIRTTNGGTSWITQQSPVDTTLFDVDFCDTLRGIIAGNGYVLCTSNGGNTWESANMNNIKEIKSTFLNYKKPSLYAYPNPFRNQTKLIINNTLKDCRIKIYDVSGNLMKTFNSITSDINWNGNDDYNKQLAAGIYFATLRTKENYFVIPIIYQR